MRQIELATLMGLQLTDSHETDDRGYIKQTYSFGLNDFYSDYHRTEEHCEDEVAREFFSELEEMMFRHRTS